MSLKSGDIWIFPDGTSAVIHQDAGRWILRRTLLDFTVFDDEQQIASYLEAHTAHRFGTPPRRPTFDGANASLVRGEDGRLHDPTHYPTGDAE